MLNNITTKSSPFYSRSIPDITPYCYGPTSIPEIIDNFLMDCNCDTEDFVDFKEQLIKYKTLLFYEQRSFSSNMINELFELIWVKFPNVFFEIFSRRKSFCKFCAKCYLFSRSSGNLYNIKNIKDMTGCRIVLYSDSFDLCYDVMNYVIKFFINVKRCKLLPAEPLLNTNNFDAKFFPDVSIPKYSGILPEYKYGVKDYFITPKEDTAYQSLHAVFLDTLTSQTVEVQLRNISMHKHAIIGSSVHSEYKEKRYGKLDFGSFIDFNKIRLNGFFSNSLNGEIVQDSQGFINSFVLFERSRFF